MNNVVLLACGILLGTSSVQSDPYDVTEPTLASIIARKGDHVILPCNVSVRPSRVIWDKETGDGSTMSVQTVARYHDDVFEGLGDGRFAINHDFALVIQNVEVSDAAIYTCRVFTSNGSHSSSWTKLTVKGTGLSPASIAVISTIVFVVVVLLLIFVIIMYRRRCSLFSRFLCCSNISPIQVPACDPESVPLGEPSELAVIRKRIAEYHPGEKVGGRRFLQTSIHIGLFGVTGGGKSAFVNSVIFSYAGEFKSSPGKSIALTKHIRLFNDSKMSDRNQATTIQEYMSRIRGKNCRSEIHCPVFVADVSDKWTLEDMMSFLRQFSEQMKRHQGRRLMVVLTHRDQLSNFMDIRRRIHDRAGIPLENIAAFENYTEESHEYDPEKSTEFLKFFWKCIEQAEQNIIGGNDGQ